MSLTKHQTKGRVLEVSKIRRRQKRQKRRLLEAPPGDWERWDAGAKLEGVNWSEYTRRALLARSASTAELAAWANDPERTPTERQAALQALPGLLQQLSEKPTPKKRVSTRAKKRLRAGATGKGSSRS